MLFRSTTYSFSTHNVPLSAISFLGMLPSLKKDAAFIGARINVFPFYQIMKTFSYFSPKYFEIKRTTASGSQVSKL